MCIRDRRAKYSVDEQEGTRVRLLDGQGRAVADLVSGGLRKQEIGTGEKARLEFYVRPAGSDRVILAAFRPPVALPEDWIDRAVLPPGIQAAQIDWIRMRDEDTGEAWRAVRVRGEEGAADTWKLVSPDSADAASRPCEVFTATLAGLQAVDVAGRASADAPGPVSYTHLTLPTKA